MSRGTIEKWINSFPAVTLAVVLLLAVLTLVAYWRIASKAGYPGCYGCGMLIPGINLVLLLLFAFARWPIEAGPKKRRKK